ncbi:MAG: hypothetical protein ACR2MN_03580 [Acidimicrobiales bacterium]
MGTGASIVIAAVGAILRFAVTTTHSHGFNIHTVGVILLVVGIVGFVISLFFWNSWGGFNGGGGYQRRRVTRTPGRTYRDRHGRVVEEPGAVVEERDGF